MRRVVVCIFVCIGLPCWLVLGSPRVGAARQAPQGSNDGASDYYLYAGRTLHLAQKYVAASHGTRWQVWLYVQDVRASDASAYARWGVVPGASPDAAEKQLQLWQDFQRAYADFFGPEAWGRFTFFHPIGPVALTADPEAGQPPELIAEADRLSHRVSAVINAILPSLENNESSDPSPLATGYFRQVHDSLLDIVRFYDQIARLPGQPGFLKLRLVRLRDEVRQSEEGVSKLTAILPNVKLPINRGWMTQSDYQGSDGTVETMVAEVGSAALIRRAWSGGDGAMTGTVMVTVVPYQDIGSIQIIAPADSATSKWTLSVHPASRRVFPMSVVSPARTTSKHSFAPVDMLVSEPFLFLDFSTAAEAQDAHAFFLHHKQLGR